MMAYILYSYIDFELVKKRLLKMISCPDFLCQSFVDLDLIMTVYISGFCLEIFLFRTFFFIVKD